jgi:glycosyltransferase involved in cell wall biosynthesis
MPGSLVSVVIPFLDPQSEFFTEAVGSVVAQDYRPLELILANDGSDPQTVELAKRLVSNAMVPARYVQHTGGANRGCSATRNLGAAAATGEYLAFLDADDVWVSTKLSEQVSILRNDPHVAMVFGHTRYWYSWQQNGVADFVVNRGVARNVTFHAPGFVALFLRGKIIVPSASNTMMRREAFLACGGFEESFRGMYEDQAFLVKLGLDHAVAGAPRCWDSYRQHPDSMTARSNEEGNENEARRAFLKWVGNYCTRRGIGAPEVREAVHKELWLAANPHSSQIMHRLKRTWLRFEEAVLPAGLRQRIWCKIVQ